jgi:hypothetical protein
LPILTFCLVLFLVEPRGTNGFTAKNDKGTNVQTQKGLFLKREGLFTVITLSWLTIGSDIFCLDHQNVMSIF